MNESKLVYSTEKGRICGKCGQPISMCGCKKRKVNKVDQGAVSHPRDDIIRIQREKKGRKGKTVTVVYGIPLENKKLQEFSKVLKRCCGSGGTVKDGVIIIQGDQRKTLLKEIRKHGYVVKIAGG